MSRSYGFSLIELMIALSLGSLLCIGIFNLFNTMQNLHRRQMVLSDSQEQMRFISQFLREKIDMAGNGSCVKRSASASDRVMAREAIRKYNADDALNKLGLTIKSGTDLLLLYECVRLHDKQQYMPIEFFVADTFRVNGNKKEIDALFYKIAHHPREELITGIINFRVRLYQVPHQKKNIRAVKIYYLWSSENHILKDPETYWFYNKTITAKNHAYYQSGIVYAARRNVL